MGVHLRRCHYITKKKVPQNPTKYSHPNNARLVLLWSQGGALKEASLYQKKPNPTKYSHHNNRKKENNYKHQDQNPIANKNIFI